MKQIIHVVIDGIEFHTLETLNKLAAKWNVEINDLIIQAIDCFLKNVEENINKNQE